MALWPSFSFNDCGLPVATERVGVPARGSAAGEAPVVRLLTTAFPVEDTPPTTPTDWAEIAELPVSEIAALLEELTIRLLRASCRLAFPCRVSDVPSGARTHRPQLPSGMLAGAVVVAAAAGVISVKPAAVRARMARTER